MDNSDQIDSHIQTLGDTVRRWCFGESSAREETALIRIAAGIARRALGRKLYLCVDLLGGSVETVATEAVTSLFAPRGPASQLARSLDGRTDSDNIALAAMFEDIVRWTARQFPYRLGIVVNPNRARLDRYLRHLIREHSCCSLFVACGRAWIAFENCSDLPWEAAPVRFDELVDMLKGGSGIPTSKGLFHHFVDQARHASGRSPVAALNDVVDAFCLFGPISASDGELDLVGQWEPDPLTKITMERCLEEMRDFVFSMASRYERSGKISAHEAKGMAEAVNDLAQEWLCTGFSREYLGLYEYLKLHLPDLDEPTFDQRLAAIFWRMQFEARKLLLASLKEKSGGKVGK